MGTSVEHDYLDTKKFPTSKIIAVESTLQQTIKQFKGHFLVTYILIQCKDC